MSRLPLQYMDDYAAFAFSLCSYGKGEGERDANVFFILNARNCVRGTDRTSISARSQKKSGRLPASFDKHCAMTLAIASGMSAVGSSVAPFPT